MEQVGHVLLSASSYFFCLGVCFCLGWLGLFPFHQCCQIVMTEPAFGGEGGLTAAASGGDALTPLTIGDITCCEHTFH